ncbi:hypothetical protein [Peribacillus sp. V2I11]|uniref:hypothetical protein n=1 Tax=Peribacillus sp. V2I11 TaxID=3042277 RepID=UPI00277FE0E1|nr:hypothetical protein [Peribacillus sp. V2I11]MDQ0884717.1 hypothetical protein [Peribacillus sp. V2I11]
MRKSKKIFYISICFFILGAVIFASFTRQSFKDNVHKSNINQGYKNSYVSIQNDEEFTSLYFNNNINNLDQLIKESDLIVKVKVSNERELYNQAILSKMKVKEVYKNFNDQVNQYFYMFEPNYFNFDTYMALSGYNILKPTQEYILFLKQLKIPNGYKYEKKEKLMYVPVSTVYSKYSINTENTTKLINSNSTIQYEQIENYEILTDNKQTLAKFHSFKKDVLDRFN